MDIIENVIEDNESKTNAFYFSGLDSSMVIEGNIPLMENVKTGFSFVF